MKILGILSMILFTLCFVPQILRLLKTKSSRDVSLGLCFMLLGGYVFGVIYICGMGDPVLVWGYSAGLVFSLITTTLAVYYRMKQ